MDFAKLNVPAPSAGRGVIELRRSGITIFKGGKSGGVADVGDEAGRRCTFSTSGPELRI